MTNVVGDALAAYLVLQSQCPNPLMKDSAMKPLCVADCIPSCLLCLQGAFSLIVTQMAATPSVSGSLYEVVDF